MIRYRNKDHDMWLVETVIMTASGPTTTWSWTTDINQATDINMGILPSTIRMFATPRKVSIETKITDLGEYNEQT